LAGGILWKKSELGNAKKGGNLKENRKKKGN
jgi:hypothetical protein